MDQVGAINILKPWKHFFKAEEACCEKHCGSCCWSRSPRSQHWKAMNYFERKTHFLWRWSTIRDLFAPVKIGRMLWRMLTFAFTIMEFLFFFSPQCKWQQGRYELRLRNPLEQRRWKQESGLLNANIRQKSLLCITALKNHNTVYKNANKYIAA